MLSVFTPTNNTRWLPEVYASLKAQTNPNWEWVVVPNGGVSPDDVRAVVPDDPRLRLIATDTSGVVGALKRFACGECKGDVLVELDHDDVLTSDALEKLAAAADARPDSFYYSDFVSAYPDGRSEVYGASYGWESYPWDDANGEHYTAMRGFRPTARSLCEIFFAPNHVRAWSRKAYDLAGGHDASLKVGDDHDLVCRTYLGGTQFVHIPEVLYVYKSHPGSTCRTDNARVQEQQRANQNRYIYPLVYEECRRRELPMIDLGHVSNIRQGFQSVPMMIGGKMSMSVMYELAPDSVGCLWASDVLQRIQPGRISDFFTYAYKALVPGGWLLTQTPSTDDGEGRPGRGAFQDPSHVSYWNPNSFWYYTHRDYAKHVKDYAGRFQLVRCRTEYPTAWHRSNFVPYVTADLYALKGQRAAGLTTI